MKIIAQLLLLCVALNAHAQLPETDIFLSKVTKVNGKLTFSTPENITNRKGYDNQPFFMPDDRSLLFVSVPDTTQSDIYSYDLKSKKSTPVTGSNESEYSPMLTPDGASISVVRVDADQGQRLYNLPVKKSNVAGLVAGTDSIGYYCWLNDSSLAMFILGNAMTLQLLDVKTGRRSLVASDIGRCMKLSIDKKHLYFVIKQNETDWGIFEMDIVSGEKKRMMSTMPGSEDFAVMPDGTFLMGNKGKLFEFDRAGKSEWTELADFSATLGDFYRLSSNSGGTLIAMVAFTGKKP